MFSSEYPKNFHWLGSAATTVTKANDTFDPTALAADENDNIVPNFADRKEDMIVTVNGVQVGYTLSQLDSPNAHLNKIRLDGAVGDNDNVKIAILANVNI